MNIAKFSEQTVLRLCSDTETTPFKVNQVADIDSLIRQIYENNSRNHSITKVEKILRYCFLESDYISLHP